MVIWTYISHIKLAPSESGVYKISMIEDSIEQVLYIGRSRNLSGRLREHKRFIDMIQRQLANRQVLALAFLSTEDYIQVEKDLIKQFNPKYNCERGKTYSEISSQIRLALDGRKLRWLVFQARIPEGELNRKMSGKMEFSDDEIKRIESALSFKIDTKNHLLNQN